MKKTLLLLVASVPCVAMASHWVPQDKIQLSDALVVGHAQNGNAYYLCQSDIDGGVQPGKTWGNYQMCNVPYGGFEHLQHQYRVYENRYAHVRWVAGDNGKIPAHAMAVGHESNGRVLYLCHVSYNGGIEPGKTWAGYNGCNVPFGGREVPIHQGYDIAVMHHGHWHHRHHHGHH